MACAAYWLFLSLLLLVPDPYALLGLDRIHVPSGGRFVHFAFFTMFALLVHASRLPFGRVWLWSTIVVYAVAVELLQWFVPHRTVDAVDLAENLLGLVAGTAIWWSLRKTPLGKDTVRPNTCCRGPLADEQDNLTQRQPVDV
jgi:hypothetical protein